MTVKLKPTTNRPLAERTIIIARNRARAIAAGRSMTPPLYASEVYWPPSVGSVFHLGGSSVYWDRTGWEHPDANHLADWFALRARVDKDLDKNLVAQ